VFETIGPVVELVVVRDKFTHESKGSAFVWYTNKADADKVGNTSWGLTGWAAPDCAV
jgi:RNA recognition motif-containing protein